MLTPKGPFELLAIDPGTHRTGLAVFRGLELVDWQLAKAMPEGSVRRPNTLEHRIMDLVAGLDEVAARHPGIIQVACEKAPGHGAKIPPAPELIVYVRRLRQWARTKKLPWVVYHGGSVVASVRPRGMKGKPSKEVIAWGVKMLYGVQDLPQDVLDAIAVGHCHLAKTKETEVLK